METKWHDIFGSYNDLISDALCDLLLQHWCSPCLICIPQARWRICYTQKKTLSPLWRTTSEQRRTSLSVSNSEFVDINLHSFSDTQHAYMYTNIHADGLLRRYLYCTQFLIFMINDLLLLVKCKHFTHLCIDRWADKLDSLSATATQDPEGFLGHPVNAFKLMKRLNTEWGDLESLVLSDTTDGMEEEGFYNTD